MNNYSELEDSEGDAKLSNFYSSLDNWLNRVAPKRAKNLRKEKHDIRHFLRIVSIDKTHNSRSRNSYGEEMTIVLTHIKDARRPERLLCNIFSGLFDRLVQDSKHSSPPKYVGMQIDNRYMYEPFYVPFRSPAQNTPQNLASAMMWLSKQSEGRLKLFRHRINVKMYAVWELSAKKHGKSKTRRRRHRNLFGGCANGGEKELLRKRAGLLRIENMDGMCLARAISLGILLALRGGRPNDPIVRRAHVDIDGRQGRMAEKLLEMAGIGPNLKNYTLEHTRKIQRVLRGLFRIVIFHSQRAYKVVFKGKAAAKHNIFILLNKHHFDLIHSTKAFFQVRGDFCVDCNSFAYRWYHNAACPSACRLCYRFGSAEFPCKGSREERRKCPKCSFTFSTKSCFERHLEKGVKGGNSICEQRYYCGDCGKIVYKRSGPHECTMANKKDGGEEMPLKICPKCAAQYFAGSQSPHFCYIQPLGHVKRIKERQKSDGNSMVVDVLDRDVRYCFFDIESTQEQKVMVNGVESLVHTPNVLIAEVVCRACMDEGVQIQTGKMLRANAGAIMCSKNCCCGFGPNSRFKWANLQQGNPRLLYFTSFDEGGQNDRGSVADQFLDFLFYSGKQSTTTYCIAHNSGRYDLHLVLDQIYRRNLAPRVIMTGLKIFVAEVYANRRRVFFKDSINFICGSLATLFNTFQLDKIAGLEQKPAFPHLWNRTENLNVQLAHLPPKSTYCPGKMKPAAYAEFSQWYEQNKWRPFNLKSTLLEYCRNDCQILRQACIEFRHIIRQIAPDLEPFESSSTIAKLALNVWKSRFLKPNMMICLPEEGLNTRKSQSHEALRFFRLYSKLTGLKIQTAEWSIGEKRANVGGGGGGTDDADYRLDGFVVGGGAAADNPLVQLAIEYHGCRYHGCRKCFPDRSMILQRGRSAEELFMRTERRKAELEKRGFKLLEVWQCRWYRLLKGNVRLRKMWNDTADIIAPPLNPRAHALFGGRVEPFRLYAECKEDEVIEIYDVVSLYPAVMKSMEFPLGEPLVYGFEQIQGMDIEMAPLPWTGRESTRIPFLGLIFLRVLPPKAMPKISPVGELLPPFLPYRTGSGHLVFPLCARCSELQDGKLCRHTDAQRSWRAAYFHQDIQLALTLGYSICEIYEIWHWPEEQWSNSEERDLFRRYINALLKIKVEASGWPAGVETDEQKRAFIDEYMVREGISIDAANMIFNPGLRMIAKLLLNSLWGKLSERPNPAKVAITKSAREFHRMLDDPRLEVLDAIHINEHLDRLVYRQKIAPPPTHNNVVIAALVTSHGRRAVYNVFREAVSKGNQLLYTDTDSLMVKRKKSMPAVSQGEFLGDMSRELPGRNIVKMVAAGPKNYAYVHTDMDGQNEKTCRKIRGFEINYEAGKKLTFNAMLLQVLLRFGPKRGNIPNVRPVHVGYTKFVRHKRGGITTRAGIKKYQAVYRKGLIVPDDLSTRPFGFSV